MAISHVQLTPQLVQAVRDAVDIVDIAGEHTRLRKAGRRHQGLCPLHKEKTPSFSVDPVQGLFYCFGCGQGGDAIKLHMLLSGDDFPAAIEALAGRYGIPLPVRRAPRRGGEEPDLEGVLEAAAEFFRDRLAKSRETLGYLDKRRIPGELVEAYGLGFAPHDWRELLGALGPRVGLDKLEAAGLVVRSEKAPDGAYDRFRNRLMFPIRNASGRLVGFGGRAMGDDKAKYINTNETSRFRKGWLLYGLDRAKRAIREGGSAFLVEGYFDVIGAVAAGLEGAVASMGTALTPEQARLLARFAEEVVVGYDADAAGERAYLRTLPLLLGAGLGVRRPALPAGHDPDSLRLAEGDEALLALVRSAPDAVDLELGRLIPEGAALDPRGAAKAAREATELLEPIGDDVLRYGYSRRAAERLGVPLDLIWKRTAPDRGRAAGRAEGPRAEAGLVRTEEEKVLQLLLAGDREPPPPADLPAAEVFLNPACRNIYAAFRDLYKGGESGRPAPREVVSRLGSEGEAVDHLARLLLEGPVTAGAEELLQSLSKLERRWRQQRVRELSAAITEAQRKGDRPLLDRLVAEKTALSLSLHGRGDRG